VWWNRVVEQSDERVRRRGEDEVRVGIDNFHKGLIWLIPFGPHVCCLRFCLRVRA
jgi:hypothetical protein